MKIYECIIDDGRDVYKSIVTAKNRKELFEIYKGNGDFIRIDDVTKDYFTADSAALLQEHLMTMGWGLAERLLISALLDEFYRKNHPVA